MLGSLLVKKKEKKKKQKKNKIKELSDFSNRNQIALYSWII